MQLDLFVGRSLFKTLEASNYNFYQVNFALTIIFNHLMIIWGTRSALPLIHWISVNIFDKADLLGEWKLIDYTLAGPTGILDIIQELVADSRLKLLAPVRICQDRRSWTQNWLAWASSRARL